MHRPAWLAAVLLALIAPAWVAPAWAVTTSQLAAHHALYRLTLEKTRSSDVVGATGTMGYEVIDACDGWAVRQRLEMHVLNSDGQTIEMVSDYATWESKDGLRFRFHVRQMTDSAVTSQTDGDAKLDRPGGPGVARYTTPEQTTKQLPAGTLFPMAHTAALIDAARSDKRFLSLPLFDGTDENGAQYSSIVVLDWRKAEPTQWPMLSTLPSTRVHIAFYGLNSEDMIPDYEVGMRYWENGVADDLRMDFGDFVMDAKMTNLAPQPRRC
ncbi:MAG TPA: cell envelope integrity EipB family protein [Acetobacteraceae bacterium]